VLLDKEKRLLVIRPQQNCFLPKRCTILETALLKICIFESLAFRLLPGFYCRRDHVTFFSGTHEFLNVVLHFKYLCQFPNAALVLFKISSFGDFTWSLFFLVVAEANPYSLICV